MVADIQVLPPKAYRDKRSILLFSWTSGSLFYHRDILLWHLSLCVRVHRSKAQVLIVMITNMRRTFRPTSSLEVLWGENCHLLPAITSAVWAPLSIFDAEENYDGASVQ